MRILFLLHHRFINARNEWSERLKKQLFIIAFNRSIHCVHSAWFCSFLCFYSTQTSMNGLGSLCESSRTHWVVVNQFLFLAWNYRFIIGQWGTLLKQRSRLMVYYYLTILARCCLVFKKIVLFANGHRAARNSWNNCRKHTLRKSLLWLTAQSLSVINHT